MSSDAAIILSELSKTYRLFRKPSDRFLQGLVGKRKQYYRELQALRDISLTISRGETVGIIGKNGSGKSTLLQLICGTVQPTSGHCQVNGRISALLELGAGFNPEFTGKENVLLNATILGMPRQEIEEKYPAIEAFAGIGEMIHQPVKTYSSGMYVRLAFAVAIASDPDILIVDEALAVGDEAFQRKCYARIRAIQERGGTILFVSHSANSIIELCNRAILLDSGEMLLDGKPKEVIAHYHKLLYAPEEKVNTLRESLKKITKSQASAPAPLPQQVHDFFDPSFIPESQVSFEPHGAVINTARITTLDGRDVNMLVRGKQYRYQYTVTLQKPAQSLQCGMMIKTKSGVLLGGGFYQPDGGKEVTEKCQLHVSFTFFCHLLPGTYFTNAGCSALVEGERIFLHRIVDALMFKVLPEENLSLTGLVDLQLKSEATTSSVEEFV